MRALPCHLLALFSMIPLAEGVITVSSPSLGWTPLIGNFDTLKDQGTGQSSADIVGDDTTNFQPGDPAPNYGMLIGLEGGQLFFRVRFDIAGNNEIFNDVLFVGIDANANGSIDAFLAMNPKTNPNQIAIYQPGAGLNISPNTTTIGDPTKIADIDEFNYDYRPVDYLTDGGTTNDLTPNSAKDKDDPDYYVSFVVPFQNVVDFLSPLTDTFDGSSLKNLTDPLQMRYMSATSTQDNAMNQDLGGVDDGDLTLTGDEPWDLGSPPLVPEPSSGILALGSMLGCLLIRRRR